VFKNIIFLPGWSFKAGIWQRQKEYFFKCGTNVLLCDLEKLKDCLDSIDISRTVFIAWSLGWFKLVDYLSAKKQMPSALIGVAPALCFQKPLVRRIIQSFKKDPDALLSSFDGWIFSPKEKISAEFFRQCDFLKKNRQDDNEELLKYLFFLKDIDLSGCFDGFTAPVLLISGKEDIICLSKEARMLREHIPHAVIEEMDAGHLPFLTNSEAFNAAIHNFINNLSDSEE